MQTQARAPIPQSAASTPARMLESRSQYCSCHISVPDSNVRLAAILLDGAYFSFFRVEKDKQRALILADKLQHRGDTTVVTKNPKGYGLWVLEPEAQPSQSSLNQHQSNDQLHSQTHSLAPYKILASRNQYRPCHIRVPDLDKRLAAILFGGKYYSLFKVVEEIQQAVQILRRLSYRGEETVITKTAKGYGLWILEPEAQID